MGNASSNEIENLKQLYSMNNFQLESLRNELAEQKEINKRQELVHKQMIANLLSKQNNIKDKIPQQHYNKVNDFLNNVDRDIQARNSQVKNWSKNSCSTRNLEYEQQPQYAQQQQQQYAQQQQPQYAQQQQQQYAQQQQQQQQSSPSPKTSKRYGDIQKSNSEIDPYALYGLQKGQPFTESYLKDKYKEYALKTHPDVEGGSIRNFNIINNAYKFLSDELKKMEKDKQFNQLKNDSIGYLETQSKKGLVNTNFEAGNFNLNKFNKVFQDNRIEDTSNEGYNEWLKTNSIDSEDIVRDRNITSGNFNSQFNSRVKVGKELQVYKLPQELNSLNNNSVQELGVEKVDNYSGSTGKIKFTDLKEAHTTSRLVDPNAKYNQYRSIDDIKYARSNMGDISQEEQELIEKNEQLIKHQQAHREENQRRMDRMYAAHHDKMHNLFLGGR